MTQMDGHYFVVGVISESPERSDLFKAAFVMLFFYCPFHGIDKTTGIIRIVDRQLGSAFGFVSLKLGAVFVAVSTRAYLAEVNQFGRRRRQWRKNKRAGKNNGKEFFCSQSI
jgi:hypothetical protein